MERMYSGQVEQTSFQLAGFGDQMDYISLYLGFVKLLPFVQHAVRRIRVAEKEVEEQRSLLPGAALQYHRSWQPSFVFVFDFGTIPVDLYEPLVVFA